MRNVGPNLYQCPRTLELFTLRIVWEYGTRTRIYDPMRPTSKKTA